MLSREFLIRLKLSKIPQWRIAQKARISPSMLSGWVSGLRPVRRGDLKVLRVGKLLGLSEHEVFAGQVEISR